MAPTTHPLLNASYTGSDPAQCAPSVSPAARSGRPPATIASLADVEAKLLHHLELAFGATHAHLKTPVAKLHRDYLITLVTTHLAFPRHVASDIVASSILVADIASRAAELKGFAAPSLFASPPITVSVPGDGINVNVPAENAH